MWQRIQTLYLLLAAITMTLLLFFPMVLITSADSVQPYIVNATGITNKMTMWSVDFVSFGLAALVGLLSLVAIFLFKNRKRQIRICIFSILIVVAFVGVVAFNTYMFMSQHAGHISIRPALFLPLLTILFLYFSIRRIAFDEALVRASRRLR